MTLRFSLHHSHHYLYDFFQSHSYYDSHLKSSLNDSRRVKIDSPHVHSITCLDLDKTNEKRFLLSCGNDRIIALYDCLPSIVNGFEYYEHLIDEDENMTKKGRTIQKITNINSSINSNNTNTTTTNNTNSTNTFTTQQPIIKPIHTKRSQQTLHSSSLTGVMWYSNDCGMFFSCGKDHLLNVWDTSTMTCVSSFDCQSSIYSMDMYNNSHGGHGSSGPTTLIACALEDHSIRLCDLNSGANIQQFIGHSSKVRCVKWSPHSEYLFASASNDGTIRLWDIRTSGWLLCMDQFYTMKSSLSKKKISVASGQSGGGTSGGSRNSIGGTSGTASVSASGGSDQQDRQRTKKEINKTTTHNIKFSPAKAYNYANIKVPLAHNDHINSLCFAHDGQYLFSSSNDRRMMKWVTQTGMNTQFNCKVHNDISSSQSCQLMCHGGKYSKLIFHAAESFVEMFHQESGEKIIPKVHDSSSHYGKILSMCFDETRQVLYTAGTDFAISILDTNYGMFASPEEQVTIHHDMDDWSD